MRLSVEKYDPGYRDDIFSLDIEVFCGGKLVDKAITADTDEGFVKFYTGEMAEGGDSLETATVYGKVQIRGLLA